MNTSYICKATSALSWLFQEKVKNDIFSFPISVWVTCYMPAMGSSGLLLAVAGIVSSVRPPQVTDSLGT
jgi:hypothetical protein